jgi:phage baseplate assembly protein W|tara:strand:+ start:3157 stop:3540 length:384 start_codon:yes stop_codon:yes gene_type:complete
MSTGLAPLLPLKSSRYELIQDYVTLASQNLKNLLLTNPGERMMLTDFGVGLRRFLFEMNDSVTYAQINSEIIKQVKKYMPFLSIDKIEYRTPENNPDLFPNTINVVINYTITPLQMRGTLQIDTNTD